MLGADRMCGKCYQEDKNFLKLQEQPDKSIPLKQESVTKVVDSTTKSRIEQPIENTLSSNPDYSSKHIITNNKAEKITTSKELTSLTDLRHNQTKAQWDKNGIVQYKDEAIAILQRRWGSQVQFIVACSQVTKEGYRLMAIDEGKEGSSGGFSGGVNAYFYFQKMDYVR